MSDILVLGATGLNGGALARALIAAGHAPRLLVRPSSRDRVNAFEGHADIREGDLEDAASLASAMAGAERLYLVTANWNGTAPGNELELRAVEAARRAGIRHVVKLSTYRADDPDLLRGRWHGDVERALIASGMDWTFLRPNVFHTNARLMWAPTVRASDTVRLPVGQGRWASVDPADIAAVAAVALTKAGHAGKIYTLTGPQSLDAAGYVALLSRVIGRPITFYDVTTVALAAMMAAHGFPPREVEAAVQSMDSVRAGDWDCVTDDIDRLLGRPPIGFETWVERNRSSFAKDGTTG